MNRFLVKVFYFILLIIVSGLFIALYNNLKLNYELKDLKGTETIVFGDSHSFRGLNPSYFESSVNFSIQAEPYIVTYWKLKKTLMYLDPNNVILSLSPHNLSSFNDLKFKNARWSSEMYRRTSFIEEFNDLPREIKGGDLDRLKVKLREVFIKPHIQHLSKDSWGGFVPINKEFRNNSEQGVNRHYYYDSIVNIPSNIQISYLDSIVNLCSDRNIKLVLVSLPLHTSYSSKVPNAFWKEFEWLKATYAEEVNVVDMSRNHNLDSSYFADSDHLNYKGAEYISKKLRKKLDLMHNK